MKKCLRKLIVAAAAVCAVARAGAVEQFWLTDAQNGDVTGPVVFVPGNKFRIGGTTFTALAADEGKIVFIDNATSQRHGPFGLVENRMIRLGDKPYYFSRIEKFTGTNPESVRTVTVKGAAAPPTTKVAAGGAEADGDGVGEDADDDADGDGAEAPAKPRWERVDLPGTNPLFHKQTPDIKITERRHVSAIAVWAEALNTANYDWKIGGYAGNSNQKLDSTVYGLTCIYGRWTVEAGFVNGSKLDGKIVPDKVYLADLTLKDGAGLCVSGSYAYGIEIDERWGASFALRLRYQNVRYNMTGTYLTRNSARAGWDEFGDGAPPGAMYYEDREERVGMDEFTASVLAGLDYEGDVWGMGLYVAFDMYSGASFTGTLTVLDEDYSLGASKRHPVEAGATAWVGVGNGMNLFAGGSVGAKMSARLGVMKRF